MDRRHSQLLGHRQGRLLMNPRLQQGFTIVELAVVVGLLGFLLALGVPAMSDMIANARVRTAAEGVLNGMQIARAEAIRRNTPVNLQIGADGISWNVVLSGDLTNTALQTRAAESSASITATPTFTSPTLTDTPQSAPSAVLTFSGWGSMTIPIGGQMTTPAAFGILYRSSATGSRGMCTAVVFNTPRLCDPQRTTATDPQACYSNNTPIPGCCGVIAGGC